MRRTIGLVTSCALAVGCAESHGPPLDAAELPEIMARAYCETLAECSMTQLSTGSDPLPWIGVEQCVRSSIYAREWQRRAAPWIEAVERGDAWIDSSEVARCVDAVHDATCLIDVRYRTSREGFPYTLPHEAGAPGLPGFHPSCDAMFVGRVGIAIGEVCEGPLDCVEGASCQGPLDACAPAHCVAAAREGDACSDRGACGAELGCLEGRCVRRVMQRTAAPGEPCGWIDDGAGGVIDERCAPGAQCEVRCELGGDCREVCIALTLGEGDACNGGSSELCAPPLVCSSLAGGECRRLTYAAEGEACDALMGSGISTWCDLEAALACVRPDPESRGLCLPRSPGAEGDRCSTIAEPCAGDLVCREGACTAPSVPVCP